MPVFSFKQVLISKISFGLLSLFFILLFSSCGEKSKKKSDKAETSVARDTNSAFQGADSSDKDSVSLTCACLKGGEGRETILFVKSVVLTLPKDHTLEVRAEELDKVCKTEAGPEYRGDPDYRTSYSDHSCKEQ